MEPVMLVVHLFAHAAHADQAADFEAITRRAIAECAPEVVLYGVVCDGAGCVALFTDPAIRWKQIASCAPWRTAHPATVSTMGGHAVCADGTQRPFFILAPDPPDGDASERVAEARRRFPCESR